MLKLDTRKTKIIILCGGFGRRLKHSTSNLPKPLVRFRNKSILQHIIEFYISKDFRNFILCTGYKGRKIEEFVKNHRFDAEIEISDAGESTSMLRRIYLAKDLIEKRAIVTYGDTFINIDPYKMMFQHRKSKAGITITVADIRSPFGLVELASSNCVDSFEEKPTFSYYIGHMIIEKKILNKLEKKLLTMPDGEGLIALFQKLIQKKKLNAFKHKGLQLTFNTFYEKEKVHRELIKFFTQQER
ncbi:MAG: nucleotidyltransferase family protein [Candidatus Omnitrophica bacterium]|nr:nucleotidyltransferase family protein [Candidatus Omnitrophota bacterium]